MLSSNDIFSRCISIVSPDYFDIEVRPLVKFILKYYNTYNSIPKIDYLNAEYDFNLSVKKVDKSEVKFTCDEIEQFCRQGALFNAIQESVGDVVSGKTENYGLILDKVQKALTISIQRDLGIDMFKDIESRLTKYLDSDILEPSGIKGLDDALHGGFARRQLTLFSANSGGGKSLMLANLGANYARRGFHVLQLALELTEQMIDLRNISIMTGVTTTEWKSNVAEIVNIMKSHKDAGAGSFILKRIPGGSNANDIRSYLKLYETEYGHPPDVLLIDYLDLMSPNSGTKNKGIYEQDKEKSEELAAIAFDYDCITFSASQQNREGLKTTNPDQSIIAGGISKVNTVDNYISIYMNPIMRTKGEMILYYLKTRSSTAVGSMTQLAFNPDNLIISDHKTTTVSVIQGLKNKKKGETLTFPGIDGDVEVPDDFSDIIVRYHEEDEKLQRDYEEIGTVDITDDSQLWDKHKSFKLTNSDTDDILAMMDELQL